MRIAALSSYDLNRPLDWSGTPYYCLQALAQTTARLDVYCRAEQEVPPEAPAKYRRYADLNKKYLWTRDLRLTKRMLESKYKQAQTNPAPNWLLFFNPSDAAYIKTDIPIAIVVDAAWKQFVLAYSPFMKQPICHESYEDGLRGEALGFNKATLLLCLTEWTAEGVLQEYPEMKHKIAVLHPGANLTDTIDRGKLNENIACRRRPLTLLFIGIQSYRKGLDIAIGACEEVRRAGIDAELEVLSTELPPAVPQFVNIHGYLNKHSEEGLTSLDSLYSRGFVLLLPARAECAAIVLCEAAAFGVPAIVSGVGGTKELVLNGCTGYVVGTDSGPAEYADRIKFLATHPAEYVRMANQARIHYEAHLNWNRFAREMLSVMGRLVDRKPSPIASAPRFVAHHSR